MWKCQPFQPVFCQCCQYASLTPLILPSKILFEDWFKYFTGLCVCLPLDYNERGKSFVILDNSVIQIIKNKIENKSGN